MLGSEPERVPVKSQPPATPQPNTPHRKKSDFLLGQLPTRLLGGYRELENQARLRRVRSANRLPAAIPLARPNPRLERPRGLSATGLLEGVGRKPRLTLRAE